MHVSQIYIVGDIALVVVSPAPPNCSSAEATHIRTWTWFGIAFHRHLNNCWRMLLLYHAFSKPYPLSKEMLVRCQDLQVIFGDAHVNLNLRIRIQGHDNIMWYGWSAFFGVTIVPVWHTATRRPGGLLCFDPHPQVKMYVPWYKGN
jgi:hypothetical protein